LIQGETDYRGPTDWLLLNTGFEGCLRRAGRILRGGRVGNLGGGGVPLHLLVRAWGTNSVGELYGGGDAFDVTMKLVQKKKTREHSRERKRKVVSPGKTYSGGNHRSA